MVHDEDAASRARAPGQAARSTKPGDTRFWCSCDTDREHPFYTSAELVKHVMEARACRASLAMAGGS
jgi:hypothetical protein